MESIILQLIAQGSNCLQGDAARSQAYLALQDALLRDEDYISALGENISVFLSVLVKDCNEGDSNLQSFAMYQIGHLAMLANSIPALGPDQVSSMWSAVVRAVEEDRDRRNVIAALFAIANQTMTKDALAPQTPHLAAALTTAMCRPSACVRRVAAAAVCRLLGVVPLEMAACAVKGGGIPMQDDGGWAPAMLCLCLDPAPGVRAEALEASRRSLACLRGVQGVGEWVMRRLKDDHLFRGIDRLLGGAAAHTPSTSPAPPLPAFPAVEYANTDGNNKDGHNKDGNKDNNNSKKDDDKGGEGIANAQKLPLATPDGDGGGGGGAGLPQDPTDRALLGHGKPEGEGGAPPPVAVGATSTSVKHAVTAWAVHMALAPPDELLSRHNRDLFSKATKVLLSPTDKFKDKRPSVRLTAIEAWGLFVRHCLEGVNPDKVPKVAAVAMRPFLHIILRDRDPTVRTALLSNLRRCVSSCPSLSLGKLWQKEQGLGSLLREMAGRGKATDTLHTASRLMAEILPLPCLGSDLQQGAHPSLPKSDLSLGTEFAGIQDFLKSLMLAMPAPSHLSAVTSIGPAVPQDQSAVPRTTASVATRPPSGGISPARGPTLDELSTSQLVVRAWCGLAFWAMSDLSHASSLERVWAGAGTRGGEAANPGQEELSQTGAKGWRQSPPGQLEAQRTGIKETQEEHPLHHLLAWLLGEQGGRGGLMPGGKAAAIVAGSPHGPQLVCWRLVILSALTRLLLRLQQEAGAGGDKGGGLSGGIGDGKETAAGFAHLRLTLGLCGGRVSIGGEQVPSRLPVVQGQDAYDGQGCAGCEMGNAAMSDVIGRSWEKENKCVLSCRPMWLWLVGGFLGAQCGHPNGREGREHPLGESTCGISGATVPPPLPEATLGEAVNLALPDDVARLKTGLLSLLLAKSIHSDCKSRPSHPPPSGEGKHEPDPSVPQTGEESSAAVAALSRLWCAGAIQLLADWKAFQDSTGHEEDSQVQGWIAPVTEPQPSLVLATMSLLREPLKVACLLLKVAGRAGLLLKEAAPYESVGGEVAEEAARKVEGLPLPSPKLSPWADALRVSAAASSLCGVPTTALWRRLAKSALKHSPDPHRLLQKLAKDCNALALQASTVVSKTLATATPPPGPGPGAQEEDGTQAALWAVGVGPTQFTQGSSQRGQNIASKARDEEGEGSQVHPQFLSAPLLPAALPLLSAVAATLLRGSLTGVMVDGAQPRTVRAGLEMLMWLLSVRSPPPPPASRAPRQAGRGGKAVVVPLPGAVEEDLLSALDAVGHGVGISSGSPFGGQRGGGLLLLSLGSGVVGDVSRLLVLTVAWRCNRLGWPPPPTAAAATASATAAEALWCWPALAARLRELASELLSALPRVPQRLLASPALLQALSPFFEAILAMPVTRGSQQLQSEFLASWGSSFGRLQGDDTWAKAFPPGLLQGLARMAKRTDVVLPPRLQLDTALRMDSGGEGQGQGAKGEEGRSDEESLEEPPRVMPDFSSVGDAGEAVVRTPGLGKGVKRLFSSMGHTKGGSSPRARAGERRGGLKGGTEKMPPAPEGVYVRIKGGSSSLGGASGSKKRVKRALVTTYTSLDGSQLSLGNNDSQLPDTEPDEFTDANLDVEGCPSIAEEEQQEQGKHTPARSAAEGHDGAHSMPTNREAQRQQDEECGQPLLGAQFATPGGGNGGGKPSSHGCGGGKGADERGKMSPHASCPRQDVNDRASSNPVLAGVQRLAEALADTRSPPGSVRAGELLGEMTADELGDVRLLLGRMSDYVWNTALDRTRGHR